MKIQNLGIEDALNRLQEKFPDEVLDVTFYTNWFGENRQKFCLQFNDRGELPSVRGYGDTLEQAQADLESKAGSRDPLEIKRAKVAQLEAELAKLQGETKEAPITAPAESN